MTEPLTVESYLTALPGDRRATLQAVRELVLRHLPPGYEEGIQYGMIGYFVPHALYPAGYHCDPRQPLPFAALAAQKHHLAVYLMGLYGSPTQDARFREAWARTGKKLDMGKSCLRFKKIEDLALDVLGDAIAAFPVETYVAQYEAQVPAAARKKSKR